MIRESMLRSLKEKGLKITPQRLAIIEVLVTMRKLHPSASVVYREAKRIQKSLSLSTTYATLKEFSVHGIIKTLQFDTGENRYDANLKEHLNLICDGCGKILDYEVLYPGGSRRGGEKNGFLGYRQKAGILRLLRRMSEKRTGQGVIGLSLPALADTRIR